MGCARGLRLAGPFGHGGAPRSTARLPGRRARALAGGVGGRSDARDVPHVLATTQTRCLAVADEQVADGVFYAETFFRTRGERELLVAVQGAVRSVGRRRAGARARRRGLGLLAALRRADRAWATGGIGSWRAC